MNNTSIQDFSVLSVIGKGSFSKVLLARHLETKVLYALKVLKKRFISESNQAKNIMTEKQILSRVQHPFLIKMKFAFQDEKRLYFALEYCAGGQLYMLLSLRKNFNEQLQITHYLSALFYSAQIVLALQALHKQSIVYREQTLFYTSLKPENIIIDKSGYLKITDFGLSKIKQKNQFLSSLSGTAEYLAPQVIRKIGHGVEVDWWGMGCLIYEMVCGHPPFCNQNRMKLFESILYADPDLQRFSPKLKNLLKKLLQKQPTKRLGHNSSSQIKDHPWFDNTNWQMILKRQIKAPIIPNLSHETDTTNFDACFTSSSIESIEQTSDINDKFKYF